ncbi:MAG: ATP-binding cassette domain-containing protein [Acutalibacteraceae bacterium]|nr:ATP-binding cassette domain-containing protein [Acutalibacteraceae bacterium]
MQLKIQNGTVELSGEPILSSVNIEINDTSKIAVVGRNGCGKTTLLKLISGGVYPRKTGQR